MKKKSFAVARESSELKTWDWKKCRRELIRILNDYRFGDSARLLIGEQNENKFIFMIQPAHRVVNLRYLYHKNCGHVTRTNFLSRPMSAEFFMTFTLFMRFVAILLPIWPNPIKPTVVALVDIILPKLGVNLRMRNAIVILKFVQFSRSKAV